FEAFPIPFNSEVRICYDLKIPNRQTAKLDIFDLKGRIVFKRFLPAGTGEVLWEADDFPSGIYVVRLKCDETQIAKKIILLR
ncbi:MAG: T9SS type A sorting domain-containing protein, partial [bacterium]